MPQVKSSYRDRTKQQKSFESVERIITPTTSFSEAATSVTEESFHVEKVRHLTQSICEHLNIDLQKGKSSMVAHPFESDSCNPGFRNSDQSSELVNLQNKHDFGLNKQKVVEILIEGSQENEDLQHLLFYTYKWYFNETELFQLLFEKFAAPLPLNLTRSEAKVFLSNIVSKVQIRVLKFIKEWFNCHFRDVEDNLGLKENFLELLYSISTHHNTGEWINTPVSQILADVDKLSSSKKFTCPQIRSTLKVASLTEIFVPLSNILDQAHFIAKNLCIFDMDNLKRVKVSEFYKKAWTKPDKLVNAPNLTYIAEMSTKLSRYVVYMILMNKKPSVRVMTFEYLLCLCDKLIRLKNFNSAFSVYLGLASHTVKRARDEIEPKLEKVYKEMFSHLKKFFSSTNNMELLRKRQEEAKPPCVPYLGIYLGDLFFLEELPDYLDQEKNKLNIKKYEILTKKLIKILGFRESFGFHKVDHIYNFIKGIPLISEEKIYELSDKMPNTKKVK